MESIAAWYHYCTEKLAILEQGCHILKYFPGKVKPPAVWGDLGSQQHGQLACPMHSAGSPGHWKRFHIKAGLNGFLQEQACSTGNDAVMRTAIHGQPTK